MTGRRLFLQQFTALLATCSIGQSVLSETPKRARRIHLGAQTNSWGVPIKPYSRLLDLVENMGKIGYEGFETNFANLETQEREAAQTRRDFEMRHCRLVASHNSINFEKEHAAEETENMRRIAAVTAAMGASYRIVDGARLPHVNSSLDLAAVHAKTELLNRLGRVCKEEGLRLCYHNHIQEFEDKPSEMSFLLQETDPNFVWFNYDVGNAYGTGPDPARFSSEHFRRIAIYHLKDVVRDPSGKIVYTEFGKGQANLKAVVAPLLNTDWEGWLNVEREENYPNPTPNADEVMRRCHDYVEHITEQ